MKKYEDYKQALSKLGNKITNEGHGLNFKLNFTYKKEFDLLNELVEKEKPKKVKYNQLEPYNGTELLCPNCNENIIQYLADEDGNEYECFRCQVCGQTLDWD